MWRALVVVALFLSCSDPVGREQLFAVDFGTVAIGEVHASSLRVKNTRYVPSRLLRIEQRGGGRGFTIVPRYEPLPSNEETEWRVHFDAFEPGLKTARFVAIFERGEAEVLLTARAAERCAVEPRIDFGAGPRGERTLSLQLINDTDQPGATFLGPLSPPFSSELTGRISLAAGERRDVQLHFAGDADGLFEQPWRVQPSPDCAATEVTLLASVQQQPRKSQRVPVGQRCEAEVRGDVDFDGRERAGEVAHRLVDRAHHDGTAGLRSTPGHADRAVFMSRGHRCRVRTSVARRPAAHGRLPPVRRGAAGVVRHRRCGPDEGAVVGVVHTHS